MVIEKYTLESTWAGKTCNKTCNSVTSVVPADGLALLGARTSAITVMTKFGSRIHTGQGLGLISQFPPFRYFPNFSASPKCKLPIDYHIYFWQVSPQLSCGDTCQIWMWYRESNWYFCKIEKFAYGEIDERSFSNPQPCTSSWRIEFPHRYGNFMKKILEWYSCQSCLLLPSFIQHSCRCISKIRSDHFFRIL